MRSIALSLSKKWKPRNGRIPEVRPNSHIRPSLLSAIAVIFLSLPGHAQNTSEPLTEKDIAETISSFETADPKKSVEAFKKKMPPPVLDSKVRQAVIGSLPEYVARLRVTDESLVRKLKKMLSPVLAVYGRENVYDLILIRHATPLIMIDSGVGIVITTGALAETRNDDELLNFIAHEIGHEYFAQYSFHVKHLMSKVKETGNEPALMRNLDKVLTIIELQCDAFAAITMAHLGSHPLAFVGFLERASKKFKSDPESFHPATDIRKKIAQGVLRKNATLNEPRASALLQEIKMALSIQ